MKAKDIICRARIELQKKNPFFSYLCMHLNPQEKKDMQFPVGVDMDGNLFYNAKWVEKQGVEIMKGVMAHEVLHLCLEHL